MNISYFVRIILVFFVSTLSLPTQSMTDTSLNTEDESKPKLLVAIETRILEFDPQSGMKSNHKVFADLNDGTTMDFKLETGVTNVAGFDIGSIRDKFKVKTISKIKKQKLKFVMTGQTASPVVLIPDIDYKFEIEITKDKYSISGCHNAYPAYSIEIDGKAVYSYKHKSKSLPEVIAALAGDCDIIVQSGGNL